MNRRTAGIIMSIFFEIDSAMNFELVELANRQSPRKLRETTLITTKVDQK